MTYQEFRYDSAASHRYWARSFVGWRVMDAARPEQDWTEGFRAGYAAGFSDGFRAAREALSSGELAPAAVPYRFLAEATDAGVGECVAATGNKLLVDE